MPTAAEERTVSKYYAITIYLFDKFKLFCWLGRQPHSEESYRERARACV